MRRLLAILGALVAILAATPARAHGTVTVSVDVTEVSPGKGVVDVRSSTPGGLGVRASFAAPCVTDPGDEPGSAARVECPGSLAGQRIAVEGLGPLLPEAVLVVALHDGRRVSRVLTEDQPSLDIPAAQSGLAVARGYVRLGVAHIAGGYDHLLFLLALVMLLRRPRAVLLAETAFTLSHSVSFSAAALGLVHVSAPAAEAAIALSLVLVALDLGRPGADTSARGGAAMAFVFGLVHGLGFAGGLAELGLPEQHFAPALAGFAAGVEIGQVAFLAVALLALHLSAYPLSRIRRFVRASERARTGTPLSALLIGGIASYWLIERTVVILSSRI